MSHKTEIDGFSGHQIQPGHGILFVREDKHLMAFQSRKAYRMWRRKRNPRKISWTEHYRHDHKKSTLDQVEKTVKVARKKANRFYAGNAAIAVPQKQAVAAVKRRIAPQRKPAKK
jgi:large subunit ribosomal protein L24e